MATPSNIQLQKGAITPAQTEQTGTKSAVSLIDSLLTQPSLPQGTSITPQAQNVQTNELLATPGVTGTLSAQAAQATAPAATMGTAATSQQVGAVTPQTASQFTAATIGTAPTMTAAQGTVTNPMIAAQQSLANIDSRATVQGQLENISQDIQTSLSQGTPLPAFARGAAEAAKATMQARGLGSSTMLAEALAEGILRSSIPIAQADANTVAQFEAQNLSNRQQRAMLAAQQRATFLGMEFDQTFQARVQNASAISDIANINFSSEQQIALENARLAQTVDLSNLSNRQAVIMAQASAILAFESRNTRKGEDEIVYFLGIDNARFRKPIIPGDILKIISNVNRVIKGIWKFKCEIFVDGNIAVEFCE